MGFLVAVGALVDPAADLGVLGAEPPPGRPSTENDDGEQCDGGEHESDDVAHGDWSSGSVVRPHSTWDVACAQPIEVAHIRLRSPSVIAECPCQCHGQGSAFATCDIEGGC